MTDWDNQSLPSTSWQDRIFGPVIWVAEIFSNSQWGAGSDGLVIMDDPNVTMNDMRVTMDSNSDQPITDWT